MKKFVSGVIVGALLFSGVTAFADSVGLTGKKVSGVFTIERNGKKLADAAIIDGSAYAPVRSVAEAAGVKLTVEGKKIIMDSGTSTTASASVKIEELQIQRVAIVKEINSFQSTITMYETDVIPRAQETYQSSIGTIEETGRKKWLDDRTAELEKTKIDLAESQKKLAVVDAQISELKK